MKPVLKSCRDCCVSCEQQHKQQQKHVTTPCYLREQRCVYATSKVPIHSYKKDASSCIDCNRGRSCDTVDVVTGFLLGDTLTDSSLGWRGWGEGIGWKRMAMASASGIVAGGNMNDPTNYNFADNTDYSSLSTHEPCHLAHDLGDVDYENGAHTIAVSASHEVTAIIDSTAESAAGILSFDFLL